MNEGSWRRLLDKLREGNVVPVVGSQLYVAPDGTSLQARVARRLLADNGGDPDAPLPAFRELNEAVSLLKTTIRLQDLYDAVHDALRQTVEADDFVIPEAIEQLARIADFRLILSLPPDDLLARALRQRCVVSEIVHSPYLPTSERKDLPSDWQERPGEVQLLYLFGKARSAPMYAIHDEDVLEYAHNIMTRGGHVPSAFLGELQQRNLLLLGCSFPDWLSRFFLRATNRTRLSEGSRRSWLIEPLAPEESLTCFLGAYSKDTEILADMPPSVFVAELYRRWLAGSSQKPTVQKDSAVPDKIMFFISYSRTTDGPSAERLYSALVKQGVTPGEIWFDRATLEPGQDFGTRILDGVKRCRYFLPVLSKAADEREQAFVFREWRAVNDRAEERREDDLILPVVVDQEFFPTQYTAKPVRAWSQIDFGHAPDGTPDQRLDERLKKLVRLARTGN